MIGKSTNSVKSVSLAEAKHILQLRQKDGELQFEQAGTLTYCEKFAQIGSSEAKHLIEKIVGGKVTEELAIKIVDVMPRYKAQLNLILAKEKVEISDDDAEKILKLVAHSRDKKKNDSEEKTEKEEKEVEKETKKRKPKEKEKEE